MMYMQTELLKRRDTRLDLADKRRDCELRAATKRRKLDESAVWGWWKVRVPVSFPMSV
jgi:hypothetical protein